MNWTLKIRATFGGGHVARGDLWNRLNTLLSERGFELTPKKTGTGKEQPWAKQGLSREEVESFFSEFLQILEKNLARVKGRGTRHPLSLTGIESLTITAKRIFPRKGVTH